MIDLHSWNVSRLAIVAVTLGSVSAAASGQIAGNASTGAGWHRAATSSSTSTTTTLSAFPTSMRVDAKVALRATVARVGQSGVPSGAVSFYWGGRLLSSQPLGARGTAAISVPARAVGTPIVKALYRGDRRDRASYGTRRLRVVADPTTITLASSANVGQSSYRGALPFAYGTTVTPSLNAAKRASQFASHPIGGISWDFHWSDLEPAAGSFAWGELDHAIAAAAAVHMPSLIRVISGPDSPGWVLSSVPTVAIPNKYFPNPSIYASRTKLPVMWSAAYLRDWEAFVRAFGARYDGNGDIHVVEITGPSIWGDMYLPPDMAAWHAAGYSDAALVSAWQQVIRAYEAAFPRTPVGLGIAEPFICRVVSPGFVNPTCAASYSSNVLGPVYAWIAAAHSSHLWLQQNNLKGSNLGREFPLRRMIEQAANWTGVGYQMGGTASGTADLHDAFEVARQDYANYVEVYMTDIENPTYASALRWLRNG